MEVNLREMEERAWQMQRAHNVPLDVVAKRLNVEFEHCAVYVSQGNLFALVRMPGKAPETQRLI